MKAQQKRKTQGPGRPRENEKYNQEIKGIVSEPIKKSNDLAEFSNTLLICSIQHPLYIKCISNTVRQIDKTSHLNFCFTPNKIYIWQGDLDMNRCYMLINCNQLSQYYFAKQNRDFIKFDVPISHICNTFNFYNRSSYKTEIFIYGPIRPEMVLDSHRTEKKNSQCLTYKVSISVDLCDSQFELMDEFLNSTELSEKDQKDIEQMDKMQRLSHIFEKSTLFNDCFFLKYRHQKIYSFSLLNADIKKFVTEVQKDCQKIQIRRDITVQEGEIVMKNIILECRLFGSGSTKMLDGLKNNIIKYKQFNRSELERIYDIGSNILKQISSNNPHEQIRFTMLDQQKVIVKIKDTFAQFKFEISNCM